MKVTDDEIDMLISSLFTKIDKEGNVIHSSKLEGIIYKNKNKIFSCIFRKKDGSFRYMNCRLGVKKGIKGTGKPVHNKSNSYLTVFDLKKNQYRVINLETMVLIKIGGTEYYVKH